MPRLQEFSPHSRCFIHLYFHPPGSAFWARSSPNTRSLKRDMRIHIQDPRGTVAPPGLVAPSRYQGRGRSQIAKGRFLHPGGPMRQQKDPSLGARRGTSQGTERHLRCHQMAEVRRGAGARRGCELRKMQSKEHMNDGSTYGTRGPRAGAQLRDPFLILRPRRSSWPAAWCRA